MAKINNKKHAKAVLGKSYLSIPFWSFMLRTKWEMIRVALALLNTGIFVGLLVNGAYEWRLALALTTMPLLILEMALSLIFTIGTNTQVTGLGPRVEKRMDALYSWFRPLG